MRATIQPSLPVRYRQPRLLQPRLSHAEPSYSQVLIVSQRWLHFLVFSSASSKCLLLSVGFIEQSATPRCYSSFNSTALTDGASYSSCPGSSLTYFSCEARACLSLCSCLALAAELAIRSSPFALKLGSFVQGRHICLNRECWLLKFSGVRSQPWLSELL